MKLTVKMKCWDGNNNWTSVETFEGNNFFDIDDQIYNSQEWDTNVEDYEILGTAE
jgi:hypothetical protein